SVPSQCKIYTYLRNNVRNFVEKYFFDTPETATTVDISTFIEGRYYTYGFEDSYIIYFAHVSNVLRWKTNQFP
ncbi:hypothetical protein, partial [Saccharococcus thermophilus]|uniref:hypothetical protein n=1 Tax=Saccharococcus thermophilus TaxID=29396 RepID=UPI00361A914A